MKQLMYLFATGITLAFLSGCGSGDAVVTDPGQAVAQPDQVPTIILNLKSDDRTANRFGANQCKKLGPEAAEALPALKELQARRAADPDLLAIIDAAIAAVEGGGAATP